MGLSGFPIRLHSSLVMGIILSDGLSAIRMFRISNASIERFELLFEQVGTWCSGRFSGSVGT